MADDLKSRRKPGGGLRGLIIPMAIIFIVVGVPVLMLNYQARRSGMSMNETFSRILRRSDKGESGSIVLAENITGGKIEFLTPQSIGQPFTDPPQISNLRVSDLDADGLPDVIACDTRGNFVSWIRQYPLGVYSEKIIASELIAPAHTQVIDFDKDGDNDILVAVLGMLFPNNDKIGLVVILENDGNCNFKKHIVADKIARVSDVRAGDLDNDGDMDMAVSQFGYDDGETRWIENLGEWKFQSHILQYLSGPINVELIDIDKDNDLDIISLVSQEWEEIYCFVNDGKKQFRPRLLYKSTNEDFGSSGISLFDLDKDGDEDIIYTNGDAFDYIPPQGRPWHGVNWLENMGNFNFEFHRICNYTGAYSARPFDIDNDGDIDLFAVSAFDLWERSGAQSFIFLENTGQMKFERHNITNNPTHLLTLELGDFNNDGLMDMVSGGMHTYPPFDRMGRVTLWINKTVSPEKK